MSEPAKNVRMSFKASPELAQKYQIWADRMGQTLSQFLATAALIGANQIARQAFPEDFLTPELLETMRKAGFAIPDKED